MSEAVLPRLLRGLDHSGAGVDLRTHLALWGPPGDLSGSRLLDEVGAAGLRGHGGAWFPAALKWRAVAEGRDPVVVANGSEGEPASAKDALLLERLPHLVLDGAMAAAAAVGARRIIVYSAPRRHRTLTAALAERKRAGIDRVPVDLAAAPERFVAGQETAAVAGVEGRNALPRFARLVPAWRKGVGGRPTLVQNVETLAHAALIARYGAGWYRQAGTASSPGTLLLTVTGANAKPMVIEAQGGSRLSDAVAGVDPRWCRAVLLGGFGGVWVDASVAAAMPIDEDAARARGASFGAGIIGLMPHDRCPLAETARVVRYLDEEKAGQCGPCVRGLPGMVAEMDALAFGGRGGRKGVDRARRLLGLCDLVEGRGACHHPDGAARLVRSALEVFAAEVRQHQKAGPCPESRSAPWLPTGGRAPVGAGR